MSRKVYIEVKVRVIAHIDEGTEVSEVVNELDYSFSDTTGKATVEDTEILDYEVKDSK
jgi:hypothetical protein